MPNGNQQSQYLYQKWGWGAPSEDASSDNKFNKSTEFNPVEFQSAMELIAAETEEKLKEYYKTDNVKVSLSELERSIEDQKKYIKTGASQTPLSLHQFGAGADFKIFIDNQLVSGTGKDKSTKESVDPYRVLGGVAKDKGFFWGIGWDGGHVAQNRYVDEFIKENPKYASSDMVRNFYSKYNKEAPSALKPVLSQLDNIYKSKPERSYYGQGRSDDTLLTTIPVKTKISETVAQKQQPQPVAQPQYTYQNWGWDLPNKPQPVAKVESENKKVEELHEPVQQAGGSVGGILSNFAMDKDISTSEYKMLKRAASEGGQEAQARIEALDLDLKRKESFGEGAQYALKRVVSVAPFVELDWQQHRATPLEFARQADPESPMYRASVRGVPIGMGQRVGMQDVADLATTVGEFMIIGGITKIPFQAALKASKTGKLTSGAYRLFTKNKKMIPVLKHVAKSNVDFGIHNFTTMHEEDLAENSTFGSKVRARFEKIPSTIVTASLFGSLGSFKNVYAQYGGVFTAGYTTAMLEATKAGLPVSEAHKQAYKSGMMLVGVHGTNALGMKAGKEYMKKYAKDKGMSEQSAQALAEQIVQKKIDEKKPIFKSKEIKDLKDIGVAEIVGETKLKNNQKAFIIKDVQNEDAKPQVIRVNDFYKRYEQTNHPKTVEEIRKGRLGKIHTLQNKLKMNDVDQYVYKRQVINPKGKIPDIKQGELPFYVDLQGKTAGELKVIADQFGLEYKITDNKATMLNLIETKVPKAKGEYLSWADANPRQLYEAKTELDRRYQVQKTKEDVQKGLYATGLEKVGNKIFKNIPILKDKIKGKPTDTEVHTERIISDYEGSVQRGLLETQNKVKEFNTIYIQEEVTPEMSRRVVQAKAGEIDVSNLSPIENRLLEIYTKQMEQGAILAKEYGVLPDVIDNYWTGIFPNVSSKQLKQIQLRSSKSGETQYSREKLYLLPKEAEAAGLKPVYDLRQLTGHWWDSVNKAITNNTLYERLGNLPTIDGTVALTGEYTPGYIPIDWAPNFSKTITGSARKKVYVHPALETQIKILLNPTTSAASQNTVLKSINNTVKRIIMVNPLIHGWNIYSDVMDEYSFRLLKTARVVLAGEKPYLLAKRVGAIKSKAEWNEMTKDQQHKVNNDILMEMAEQGIGIAESQALTTELQGFYRKNYSELSVSDATFGKRLKNFGRKVKKNPLNALKLASDNFLWDKIVKNSQISIYALTKSRARKAGLSEVDSKRAAAHYTKDLLGMLPKSAFSPDGLASANNLNYLFFARNWTISNLRLVSGAAGYRGNNLNRFVSHKSLSPKEMKFLQEQYTAHIIKGVLGTIVSVNLLNYAFTGIEEEKNTEGKVTGYKFNKDKAHWATENEEGHEMDIDTGTYNRKGGKVYVENLIFRYIKDYFNWVEDPRRTFLNKVHPVPKAAIEQLINMTLWNGRKIIQYPDQETMKAKAKLRLLHLLYAVTPYGQFVGQPNKLRTSVEKIAPWFGTWIKSGVAGGDYADKINKFVDKKKYELDEIDKQIDLIAQTGDMSYVINELIEKERFKTIDGIRDRLQKYKNPLLYKYMIVLRSKADKAEFLNTLTEKEREEFFEVLKVGNQGVRFYEESVSVKNKIKFPIKVKINP
mgnify:CR=1 FL=1|tara:strand:+ start:1592 stop:6448 length:4857 start_codon:yes stop_codon:yes gene_type:complete